VVVGLSKQGTNSLTVVQLDGGEKLREQRKKKKKRKRKYRRVGTESENTVKRPGKNLATIGGVGAQSGKEKTQLERLECQRATTGQL